MTPTDEKFAQLDRIEQECFHGSWTSETLLSEINSPLNVLCTEESGGITAGFALGRVVADEAELFQIAARRDEVPGGGVLLSGGAQPEFRGDSAVRESRVRVHLHTPELLPGRRRGDLPNRFINRNPPGYPEGFCVL